MNNFYTGYTQASLREKCYNSCNALYALLLGNKNTMTDDIRNATEEAAEESSEEETPDEEAPESTDE